MKGIFSEKLKKKDDIKNITGREKENESSLLLWLSSITRATNQCLAIARSHYQRHCLRNHRMGT